MCRLAFLARSLVDPVVKVKLEIRGSTVAPAYGDAFEQRVVEEFSLWNEFGKSQKIVLTPGSPKNSIRLLSKSGFAERLWVWHNHHCEGEFP